MIRVGEKWLTGYKSSFSGYEEVFVNPSRKELMEAAGDNHMIRFFAHGATENVYVGSEDLLHSFMSEAIFGDKDEIPQILFEGDGITGVAMEGSGRFEMVESFVFAPLFYNADSYIGYETMKYILEQDWS